MLIPRTYYLIGSLLMLLSSTSLFAAPDISLTVVAEKEIAVKDESGKKMTRRVETTDTAPGDVLFYTIRYRNGGDEPARNVQLDNPIPAGTAYVNGSAWGDGAEILFSIDGGKTFAQAKELTADDESQPAEAAQYDAIRWRIAEIQQGAEGAAGFSVTVQ